MAVTPSKMIPLGTPCPDFSLPDTVNGGDVSRADANGKPILVMFICNHCPFVIHVKDEIGSIANEYANRVFIVAICSNDPIAYPEDGPIMMTRQAELNGWRFPYLHDATQSVARAFGATCTPDFFLYDSKHHLVYRGQLDSSRPRSGDAVTGSDLRSALEAMLNGDPPIATQLPSMGCNIKWLPTGMPKEKPPISQG